MGSEMCIRDRSLPLNSIISGSEFLEPRVPYTVDVLLTIDVSSEVIVEVPIRTDGYSDLDPAQPSDLYDPSSAFDLIMLRPVYDESAIPAFEEETTFLSKSGISFLSVVALFAIILSTIAVGIFLWARREEDEFEAEIVNDDDSTQS